MPPELFSRSAPDMGRWTGYSEKVFRLIDVDQNLGLKYKPRTRKEWKKQARDSGNRRALIRADQQALALLCL